MIVNQKKTRQPRHRKGFLIFGGGVLLIGLVYLFLCAYDNYFSKADGLINNYAYHKISWLICVVWFTGFLLYLGLSSRRRNIQNVSLSLCTVAIVLILLEIVAHVLIGMGTINGVYIHFQRYYPTIASSKPLFWGDFNEQTGRWRAAQASNSILNCAGDSVFWHTNSVGASDRERTVSKSSLSQKRVITLGDSFMEGMLVNAKDRMSNLLEAATGREHMNFAVNDSSPINYYLTYKGIAKRFEHDVVLVSVLPANDFQDYSPAEAYKLAEWPIYRPYWSGDYPAYRLKYSLNNINQSILRNNQTPAQLLKTVDSVYSQLTVFERIKADVLLNSGLCKVVQHLAGRISTTNGRVTRYEQFSDAEFKYMTYSLEQLAKEAKGKKLAFLSVPVQNDIEAVRNGRKNKLDDRLQKFCDQHGILFIPLLPAFLQYKGNLADLYVDCDGHWSKKGEQFASDVLLRNAQYQSLLN
ncbi:MAG TPA: hypothetical protein VK404_10270 [Spirosoma sp.]|jgi:hypothetical protein|nr:hypothetical protein [Spirosoma sp.]